MDRGHTSPHDGDELKSKIEKWLFKKRVYKFVPNLSDGCPPSYMHPTLMDSRCAWIHRDYYREELFYRKTRDEYENGH
jgi:hypothetical protein